MVKTIRPANRIRANSPFPPVEVPQRAWNTTEKTKVKTASISSGVSKAHRIPRTDPR
ncbi:hypothetical protein D3C71_1908150 [compost metagenome]